MNIDQYFSDHYNTILEFADNIYKTTEIDPHDAVAELYLNMKHPDRKLPSKEKELKYWILRTLKNWTWHEGGNPMKKHRISEGSQDDRLFVDLAVYEMDSNEVSKDLKSVGFTHEETEKIMQCIEVSKEMPIYYKRIFVLYYIDGLTMEEIGASCGLPKSTIFGQVKQVQHYIKEMLELNPQKRLFPI